jgi:hypothetical protein
MVSAGVFIGCYTTVSFVATGGRLVSAKTAEPVAAVAEAATV